MDFSSFFSFENIVLAVVGIIGIVGFVASLRLMRKDRVKYSQRHKAMEQRMQETHMSVREYTNAMHSDEQRHVVAAALRDMLCLFAKDDVPLEIPIVENEDAVVIHFPHAPVSITYIENNVRLQASGKRLQGAGHWEVRMQESMRTFASLTELERHLLDLVRSSIDKE